MSFFVELVKALSADVAAALSIDPAAVYLGRDPQKVTRTGLEVWIRPVDVEASGRARLHVLELHLRLKARREGNLTGGRQLELVLTGLDALCARFDGRRPFAQALPALIATDAEHGALDHDAEDQDVLDGTLRLRVLEG